MGTQEVELERAGEKSAVDGSDPVCSNKNVTLSITYTYHIECEYLEAR